MLIGTWDPMAELDHNYNVHNACGAPLISASIPSLEPAPNGDIHLPGSSLGIYPILLMYHI